MKSATTYSAALVVLLAALANQGRAQTSYPMITRVEPTAVQRGQTVEITVHIAQAFDRASALLFEGKGLSAEVLKAESKEKPRAGIRGTRATGKVQARLTVAPDADLGPRELRVVTTEGVSSVGMIVIVADPVITEADDKANDTPAGAQEITLPASICGIVEKNEDVDWYAFHAEAGQRITFNVWGNRLENKIHDLNAHLDPILQLFDETGRELAADDNALFADPMLSYEFKNAGTYRVQIRDTTYSGDQNWPYVLQATAGPYATSVFPLAVHPGEAAEVHARGFNINDTQAIILDVPGDARPGPIRLPLPTDNGATRPIELAVTDLPLATETDDASETLDKAQALTMPVALSGRLGEINDTDAYRFEAKKGQVFTFEIQSRRIGSQADPVVRVIDEKGKRLAEQDDTFGKDPRLDWTSPAEGVFAVQVTDLHSRGGPDFGYVLLAESARPDFTVTCDPDKINVSPGGRTTLFVKVDRRTGFKGPVTFTWEGLPEGVSASPLTVPETMDQGEIVVSALSDAKLGGTLVRLRGEAETDEGSLTRWVQPRQEIYSPGGGRALFEVETLALAVTEPSDITVEAKPERITLQPGKTATIDVTVERREGFDGPVNLAIELSHLNRSYASPLPKGVSVKSGSKTLLGPKETAGKIILEAKADAQCLRGSADRRHGPRLDQLRRQDSLQQCSYPPDGARNEEGREVEVGTRRGLQSGNGPRCVRSHRGPCCQEIITDWAAFSGTSWPAGNRSRSRARAGADPEHPSPSPDRRTRWRPDPDHWRATVPCGNSARDAPPPGSALSCRTSPHRE